MGEREPVIKDDDDDDDDDDDNNNTGSGVRPASSPVDIFGPFRLG